MKGHVLLSHGMESGPQANKVTALAAVAQARGWRATRPDFLDLDATRDAASLQLRIERLLAAVEPGEPLVLAGSSLGAFCSALASLRVPCRGLFLMAPPLSIPGFEARLAQDAELREETQAMRDSILAIELGGFSRKLKEVVAEEGRVIPIGGRNTGSRPWQYFAYAASIAALIAVAFWFFTRPPLNERLFTQYHYPDPGLPVAMSATNDHLFHDAMVAYKLGDHEEAREKWISLLNHSPDNDTLLYYIASTHLNEDRPHAAIPLYERVIADPSSVFTAKARWYLYLSKVHVGEKDPALLEELLRDPDRKEAVQQIQKQLEGS